MFFTRLEALCAKDAVKDVSGLLKTLGLSTSKGTAWRNGSIPKGDILLKIANYFHVSTDYLLGRTDEKGTPAPEGGSGLTDEQADLVNLFEAAPPAIRAAALAVLKSAEGQDKAPDGVSTNE